MKTTTLVMMIALLPALVSTMASVEAEAMAHRKLLAGKRGLKVEIGAGAAAPQDDTNQGYGNYGYGSNGQEPSSSSPEFHRKYPNGTNPNNH
ncbi:hypothetical protein SLEP1_g45877 [Rubroshorea leprosula]|uniref:Uncharacterized protein n=1 Tax=Rubroshorea leprosula TaxID=152421 RepID=A0AAV5LM23_9ROSI|nr:hypothetical protein SLEP1_g45877 [Rubroshorea leprosula]